MSFMKAVLSFEDDAMKEAADRLGDAASVAGAEHAKAQKVTQHGGSGGAGGYFESEIYDKGTQYSLTQAEAWIMGAVVGILNFSTVAKGFWNVRKAYLVMDAVVARERAFAERHQGERPPPQLKGGSAGGGEGKVVRGRASREFLANARQSEEGRRSFEEFERGGGVGDAVNGQTVGTNGTGREPVNKDEDSDDEQFEDAPQWHVGQVPNSGYLGNTTHSTDTHTQSSNNAGMANLSVQDNHKPTTNIPPSVPTNSAPPPSDTTLDLDEPEETDILPRHLITNPMDAYIHSSTHLFFGLLQLMLSLIPPTMSRLLSTIGFSGSRSLGLQMLWRSASFSNLNGAMAGIILTSYYTGLVAYLDILPASGPAAFPIQRCKRLIEQMRERYPKSTLVMLQEVRMLTTERRLDEAVEMIEKAPESEMKQVRALQWFERSLDCMYAHRFEECADGFERCVKLNNWSHGLVS